MYSLITSGMTWSYSRITTFEHCPYKFFLTYIKPHKQAPMFFSDYGSFVHEILGKYYEGELEKNALVSYYLTNFTRRVKANAPSSSIFQNYFRHGMECLKSVEMPKEKILGIEQRVQFAIEHNPFEGVVDLILQDSQSNLAIIDHKSRALKARSTRGKHTKSDETLDSYLRQLYLYSIPIAERYGRYPTQLVFNCYRSGEIIIEPFREEGLQSAKRWAVETIRQINAETQWEPCIDYYHCKHLCGIHDFCEYYNMK